MRMTKQRAKELAIIIWTKLVETGLSYIQKIAIVDELYANSTITEREQIKQLVDDMFDKIEEGV